MKSEKQKMRSGQEYDPSDPELVSDRARARGLCRRLNSEQEVHEDVRRALLPGAHPNARISTPFYCDYGYNIELADGVYFNVNCVLLDICTIRVGANSLFGPGVHIYTVNHPLDAKRRRSGVETGAPVEIGDATVIGAGSVVTRSMPAGVLAAGNPCRVIRML